jgi:4-amino-4-deoxy-L-arabinose transferase-like glycosyltransferase
LRRLLQRVAGCRPDFTTLLGIGALAGTLVYSLATLTRFPLVYGDEAWIGSTAWSFVSGHGFRASITVGGGVYDHGAIDYWLPRTGTFPFIVADLIAGPSFWAFRFAAFLVGVGAITIFVLGLRRPLGAPIATMAGVVLASSWGFFSTSHYIRWDSLAFALACVILAGLARGSPGPRACLLVGVVLGIAPDVEGSMLAAVPAVLLLILWEHAGRLVRLKFLALGAAAGALVYASLHEFPWFGRDGGQFDLVYGPVYKIPLRQMLDRHSLAPLWDEKLRYHFMTNASPADLLSFQVLVLGVAACLVMLVLRRPRSAYPTHLVPGLLLVSHLGGLALIQQNKSPIHGWFALPYAIAAIAECLRQVASSLPDSAAMVRRMGPIALLALLAALQLHSVIDVQRATPQEPIFDKRFPVIVQSAVHPGESVLGDFFYWWGFKNLDYHWNAWIWNYRWAHHASLDAAFNRLCPDVVLYDDVWNSRYAQIASFGPRFPNLAPTDPGEQAALDALLQREYTLARDVTLDGRKIQFWRRRPGACDGILTNGGGTS